MMMMITIIPDCRPFACPAPKANRSDPKSLPLSLSLSLARLLCGGPPVLRQIAASMNGIGGARQPAQRPTAIRSAATTLCRQRRPPEWANERAGVAKVAAAAVVGGAAE